MKKYSVLVPKRINYQSLIAKNPLLFKNVNIDAVKGILGEISREVAKSIYFNSKNGQKIKHTIPSKIYVSIEAKRFKYLFSDDYALAMKLLEKTVIFKKPYSAEYKTTYKFAFNDVIVADGFRIDQIKADNTKSKTIVEKLNKRAKKTSNGVKKKYGFLIKNFDSSRLTIDMKSVSNEIDNELIETGDISQSLYDYQKCLDIHNGFYSISLNPKSDGRFHSSFVRLNKKYRKYLRYDGEDLYQIDLSNSIPFILSSVLTNSINVELINVVNVSKSFLDNKLSYMILKTSETASSIEFKQFHKKCADGTIYDDFISPEIKSLGSDNILYKKERKSKKVSLLKMMFAKNGLYQNEQMMFSEVYSNTFEVIKHSKLRYSKRFSHFLFQLESHVVLDLLARKFNNKNRGRIPIFTIHDCLVTTESYVKRLYDFIESELKNIFTMFQPKFKIEPIGN